MWCVTTKSDILGKAGGGDGESLPSGIGNQGGVGRLSCIAPDLRESLPSQSDKTHFSFPQKSRATESDRSLFSQLFTTSSQNFADDTPKVKGAN